MLSLFCVLAGTALIFHLRAAPPGLGRSPSARPNILIIVTDDQRVDEMKALPHTRRWLGHRAVSFPNGFATTPLCCPSRTSIFTGRYAHNHGVETNTRARTIDQGTTLQRFLSKAGYTTALFGKYLNSWPIDQALPHFDRWTFFKGPNCYYDCLWNSNGAVEHRSTYSTSLIDHRAHGFLRHTEGSDRKPWLLMLTTSAPHEPFTPETSHANATVPPWRGNPATRESDLSDKPRFLPAESRKGRGAFVGQERTLLSVDDLVTRLRSQLVWLEEMRNTLIFFLSDNGILLGEHHMPGKGLPYTQSVRVPFYGLWQGHLDGGVKNQRIVANIDIAPTILDAAGIPQPTNPPMDGNSLLSAAHRQELLLEYWRYPVFGIPTWGSLRSKRFQYVEYYDSDKRIFREYYNLNEDPWELDNLLNDANPNNGPNKRRLEVLHRKLLDARACEGVRCP